MRGNPLARAAEDVAIVVAALERPLRSTRRTRTAAVSPPVRSIQLTSAAPSRVTSTSTRPAGRPWSIRIGAANVAPASREKAMRTIGVSLAAVNHATATLFPRAATDGPLTGHALIFQPSACTATGSVQRPASTRRTTAMSRISSGERSRYTITGPLPVIATDVWQQSHTRPSRMRSGSEALPSRVNAAVARLISFVGSSPARLYFRPSSQTASTPSPRAVHHSDTNPCSVFEESVCGVSGALQVRPRSLVNASLTPYAYVAVPVRCNQCATRRPSPSESTDGKSAQFTKKSRPERTSAGTDHSLPLSEATLRTCPCPLPSGSSQLIWTTPSGPTSRFGSALPGPAGLGKVSSTAGASATSCTAVRLRKWALETSAATARIAAVRMRPLFIRGNLGRWKMVSFQRLRSHSFDGSEYPQS